MKVIFDELYRVTKELKEQLDRIEQRLEHLENQCSILLDELESHSNVTQQPEKHEPVVWNGYIIVKPRPWI